MGHSGTENTFPDSEIIFFLIYFLLPKQHVIHVKLFARFEMNKENKNYFNYKHIK